MSDHRVKCICGWTGTDMAAGKDHIVAVMRRNEIEVSNDFHELTMSNISLELPFADATAILTARGWRRRGNGPPTADESWDAPDHTARLRVDRALALSLRLQAAEARDEQEDRLAE